MQLQRALNSPVLKPRKHVRWERNAVFNAAVVHESETTHLFYRGVYHEGEPRGEDRVYTSCIGHARSRDGIHFQCDDDPVLYARIYANGTTTDPQDPRVVKIDQTYYMVYTNHINQSTMEAHYAISEDLKHWEEKGPLFRYDEWGLDKNALLFPRKIGGRFAALHRPEDQDAKDRPRADFDYDTWSRNPQRSGRETPGVVLSYSDDLVNWSDTTALMHSRDGFWDSKKIGPGAPPIETPDGWLTIYHGISQDHAYSLGLVWLDREDPTKIIHRQKAPVLQPKLDWEVRGDVPNVVFTCGACVVDNELHVYYGGADTVIGLATCKLDKLAAKEE